MYAAIKEAKKRRILTEEMIVQAARRSQDFFTLLHYALEKGYLSRNWPCSKQDILAAIAAAGGSWEDAAHKLGWTYNKFNNIVNNLLEADKEFAARYYTLIDALRERLRAREEILNSHLIDLINQAENNKNRLSSFLPWLIPLFGILFFATFSQAGSDTGTVVKWGQIFEGLKNMLWLLPFVPVLGFISGGNGGRKAVKSLSAIEDIELFELFRSFRTEAEESIEFLCLKLKKNYGIKVKPAQLAERFKVMFKGEPLKCLIVHKIKQFMIAQSKPAGAASTTLMNQVIADLYYISRQRTAETIKIIDALNKEESETGDIIREFFRTSEGKGLKLFLDRTKPEEKPKRLSLEQRLEKIKVDYNLWRDTAEGRIASLDQKEQKLWELCRKYGFKDVLVYIWVKLYAELILPAKAPILDEPLADYLEVWQIIERALEPEFDPQAEIERFAQEECAPGKKHSRGFVELLKRMLIPYGRWIKEEENDDKKPHK
jgi:hypothetical protein